MRSFPGYKIHGDIMGYTVYTVSTKQYFGITANFEARPALDLADAARDEPLTWIGAQLKASQTVPEFRVIETHDTLFAAIASQVRRIAQCRSVHDDPWYDEVPPGYYPADDGVDPEKIDAFARHRGAPYLLPWMSEEAVVALENDIMWNDRDATQVFHTQGDVADLLAYFYCETLIRRRTVVSSSAAYNPVKRNIVFKTSGAHPDTWDAATPAEFAETAATWICDRAEQFALRVLSGRRCDNPKIDMQAMRILARDALRVMHQPVGTGGTTAIDVARARVSRHASKIAPGVRADLVETIRLFMTEDMPERMRVYNIRQIMPNDHPDCGARSKTATPPWTGPPVVVPESFSNLESFSNPKSKRELPTAA